MIERSYAFEDCFVKIAVQGADRSGHLWGVIDLVTPDGKGHLVSPRRISLFDPRDWTTFAAEAASRNSGNTAIWHARSEEIRAALVEDHDVLKSLDFANFTTSQPLKGSEVVKLRVVRLSDSQRPGPRRFRVEGLLPEGWPTLAWGDSGQGKSYMGMALGQCVAVGVPFLGLETVKGHVLYADWELDETEQTRRAFEVAQGMYLDVPPVGFDYVRMTVPFADAVEWIQERIDVDGYDLIILDSFGLAVGGDPESARFVIPFFGALRRLNATTLVIDHQSRLQTGQKYRDKDAFGSIYKKHLSRSGFQVQAISEQPGKKGLVLRHAKTNFADKQPDTYAWLEFSEGRVFLTKATEEEMSVTAVIEEMNVAAQIRVAIQELGPSTVAAIAELADLNVRSVRNEVTRMKQSGDVAESGKEGHASVYDLA